MYLYKTFHLAKNWDVNHRASVGLNKKPRIMSKKKIRFFGLIFNVLRLHLKSGTANAILMKLTKTNESVNPKATAAASKKPPEMTTKIIFYLTFQIL